MYYYVYKTTNLANQKFYYGVHKSNKVFESKIGLKKLIHPEIKGYKLAKPSTDKWNELISLGYVVG